MGIVDLYQRYVEDTAVPHARGWPLMGSPFPMLIISFAYLYFVLKCGPRYMQNRQPYTLKTFIRYYNIFQIVTNTWIVYRFFKAGWLTEISLLCTHETVSFDSITPELVSIMWWVTMNKIVDLIETGLFVLRKKQNQISFLHLYHHVSTMIYAWYFTKYVPVPGVTFYPFLNCGVHVIMYTYYFLSTYQNSQLRKLLHKVKPVVTTIQMVQFLIMLVHCLQGWLPSCPIQKTIPSLFLPDIIINYVLFSNFYKQTYTKSKSLKTS